jgi:methylated-DNA-[protein]-cysteine S-methyltransferase
MRMYRAHVDTPVGPMLALATDEALCALEFHRGGRLIRLERRLDRWFAPYTFADDRNPVINQTSAWLDGYFSGGSARIDGLPLDMRGAAFELRVWAALTEIPPGATASYGQIAKRLGDPGAARAVGMANGANPIAIIVPCHRVIGANGSLTGYGGGLDKKTWLLEHERRWRSGSLF